MLSSWSSCFRKTLSRFVRRRTAPSATEPSQAAQDRLPVAAGRTLSWRNIAQTSRPLLITLLAALAFTALLRYHHAKFEDSMVRSFQKQQMDAARGWADAMENQAAGFRRDLASLATHPDIRRFSSDMNQVLAAFLSREKAIGDELEVRDAQGVLRWRQPPPAKANADSDRKLRLVVPIEHDGKAAGTLQARVGLDVLLLNGQPTLTSTYRSFSCLLSNEGSVVYGSDLAAEPMQMAHVLRDPDAPKETADRATLLSYVADHCVGGGASGLAEVVHGNAQELAAFVPVILEGRRYGLLVGSPRADVSVPIASHERVTYALLIALTLLYFATGYTAYRSERAHTQLEEQRRRAAEEASRAKGDFLAKMSHELRTPLNGILGMTDLALRAPDTAQRQTCLGTVKQCANALLSVINDILDMSKIEARRLNLALRPLNVPECVAGTLSSLAPLARDKGLSLRWEIEPGVPSAVRGDPGRLRQILTNLVGNAIKFTGTGEVVVQVAPEAIGDGRAVLTFHVRDTGPGMSPEDQMNLFHPYHQCSHSAAYRKDSTGLGLAIAKQLVERMGGTITVQSQPGQGTVFTFTAAFELAASDPADAGTGLPPLKGLRVLLISGEAGNPQRFARLLTLWAAHADMAGSAEAGLAAMAQAQRRGEPFDLLLLNSGDSPAEAFAFAEKVAALEGCEQAALVVLYPAGMRGDAAQCLQAGIDAYLGFPAPDDQVHIVLRLAMEHAANKTGRSALPRNCRPDAGALNILLAEDNPVNQQVATLMLRQWGHRVRTVASGQEALAATAEEDFDLVLMDLEMPGLNGLEAAAGIRRREQGAGRHVPIIAITAHAMDSDRSRCLEAGMDEYVSKPFQPDHLRAVIAKMAPPPQVPANPPAPSAARPDETDPQAHWNSSTALRYVNGDKNALAVILETFLKDLRETLPKAQQAAAARDGRLLGAVAHRWKGTLGLLGAARAQACAERLEELCRMEEPERLLESFHRLAEELMSLETALRSAREENASCRFS